MRKVFMLNNFSENEESPRFSGDIIQNLRRAILAPPEYKKNIQEALQNVDFKFHRRCSYANLIRECNVAEGQTLLIFWGYGTSDSGITIMSASSSTSILMSPGTQGNLPLRSTGQQTDISCGYSSFASPVLVGEAESQRALRERLADSLTYAAPPSPPPAHRSASILGSVCALLLRKQGSSGAGAIAGKEASGARSRQSGSICRICFGGASRERLARPCACRGTVAAVHRSCLERWLLQAATSHCELCRYHYVVTRTHKWSWWRAALAWARGGGARALLADASRGAALAAGALLGTARALRACDAALQAGARRGGLPALAANVFSSLLIGLVVTMCTV
ncbi:PREDICTED: uncharacterized protein LOC106119591 [Papilio xuthus]|uniref:Uncharacterized protein LOC106119591 n=1 Tax=Papilio xuthus TaxID=66420 RepID=A0AAJ7EB37_PAPXU|nr:PREDICTED: uncharacterized protein LOC106119591 [Papilio xuthus]